MIESTPTDLYDQLQRAHENLHALLQRKPSAFDTERQRAHREAIAAEHRVIRLCREALGWGRSAA